MAFLLNVHSLDDAIKFMTIWDKDTTKNDKILKDKFKKLFS